MSQPQLLKRLVLALQSFGVPYMLTGSIVSSLQGEPRSTHDIDVVVELDAASAGRLKAAFPEPEFYLTDIAIREAISHRSMFSILNTSSGDKIDLWMLTEEVFDQSRFVRREPAEVFGLTVFISRPEDTIVQKLLWSQMSGGSEKHFRDALSVYEVHRASIDEPYIHRWTSLLNVLELWRRLMSEADT